MNVHLEGFEAAGIAGQFVHAVAPGGFVQKVAAGAVRVESDSSRKLPPSSFDTGWPSSLPARSHSANVDAAQHPCHPPALRIGVKHVVEVDLNRQRVFADQSQVGQAWAFQGGDGGAGIRPAAVTLAIAVDAGVGLDLDQRALIVQFQRLDGSDLYLPCHAGMHQR